MNNIIVTIRCLVYNHEPYLRDCLEGFVMQKTNFKFEAIVHDDCSTDGSANIIKEYAEKYPAIIKPIIEQENQYSKHDGSLKKIMDTHTRGKYTALCEGDDYWTDPYKLQKQVDFLESHSDYTMCFANAIEHWENDSTKFDKRFSNIENREYSGLEIFQNWIVPTASVLYRTSINNSPFYLKVKQNPNFIYGDIILFLSCAHLGKIRGMVDCMSVYRRLSTGAVLSMSTIEDGIDRSNHLLAIECEFGNIFHNSVAKLYVDENLFLFYKSLLEKCGGMVFLKKSLKYSLLFTLKRFLPQFFNTLYIYRHYQH